MELLEKYGWKPPEKKLRLKDNRRVPESGGETRIDQEAETGANNRFEFKPIEFFVWKTAHFCIRNVFRLFLIKQKVNYKVAARIEERLRIGAMRKR